MLRPYGLLQRPTCAGRDLHHIAPLWFGLHLSVGREPEDRVMMLRTIIWVYGVLVLVGFYMGATPF
jgi:hypothetical protein